MTDYTWITDPPIRALNEVEIAAALEKMRQNMVGWDAVAVPANPLPPYLPPKPGQSAESVRAAQLARKAPDIDVTDWKTPRRTFQERWNDRIGSTNTMLEMTFSGDVVGYFFDNAPIALMELIENDPIYIADLVCHPGSENGGGIMIEYAVNRGVKVNKSPMVQLFALDEDAGKAYQQLGFAYDSGNRGKMTLDPRTSAKWASSGERWHLAKFATLQTYLA